jgi:3-hydroxybutyryl-CoA dehydrogenase
MIERIAVIGSGVMGRGIAYVAAAGGFSVKLFDVQEESLLNARDEINQIFQKGIERNKLTEE